MSSIAAYDPSTDYAQLNEVLDESAIVRTRWIFCALCWYLLSQAFVIPFCTLGPSWAVWPTFCDVGVCLTLAALVLSSHRFLPMSTFNAGTFRSLVSLTILCLASYVLLTILTSDIDTRRHVSDRGRIFGAFELYRLMQFLVIFLAAARVEMTPQRTAILRRICSFVLIVVCGVVLLTYFSLLQTRQLAAHLPADLAVAGPWAFYSLSHHPGWSSVGYNHSYTAAQILMLIALRIHLAEGKLGWMEGSLVLLSLIGCFASGSRSGMASLVFFSAVIWFRRPLYAVIVAAPVVCSPLLIPLLPTQWQQDIVESFERQRTTISFDDRDNGRHGLRRFEIWKMHVDNLNDSSWGWLCGTGMGTAHEVGKAAHNLYLHIVVEGGLIGLLIASFIVTRTLRYLHWNELFPKPIMWATAALLLGAISQETFYPVPSMGQFGGLFLFCIALALRAPDEQPNEPVEGELAEQQEVRS